MTEKQTIYIEYLFDLEIPIRKNDIYMPFFLQEDWMKTMSDFARMIEHPEIESYIKRYVKREAKKGSVINGATLNININSRQRIVAPISGISDSDILNLYDAAKEETNVLGAFGKLSYLERAMKELGCKVGPLSRYDPIQISQIGGLWAVMCSAGDADSVIRERNINWVKSIDELFYNE